MSRATSRESTGRTQDAQEVFSPVDGEARNMAEGAQFGSVGNRYSMLFHEHGDRLVQKYMIFSDPLPHRSLRGRVITKLLAFTDRAMALAQLTALHLSIPSSGTTLTGQPDLPDDQNRLDSVGRVSPIPKQISRHALAAVSFSLEVELIVSKSARSSRRTRLVSSDLLRKGHKFA